MGLVIRTAEADIVILSFGEESMGGD